MIKSRLNINGSDVGFLQELPISTNFSVGDIRDPEKRSGIASKTIIIPGEPEVKKLFEFIFQVNSSLTSFNPNLKTPAKYYVNEVLVFDGSLQLLKINNKFVNDYSSTEFECSLIGGGGNLFLDIAGKYLTDINYSDLDHEFTYVSGMVNPPVIGSGYVYGYQDYGLNPNGAPLTNEWYFRYLKPLIFEREIFTRIIKYAGFSWNGSQYVNNNGDFWASDSYSVLSGGYWDSDYAKHILIPDNSAGALKLTDADKANNACYIGRSGVFTGSNKSGTLFGSNYGFYTNFEYILSPVQLNDESNPYYDTGNIWDAVTNFRMTVNQTGTYFLYASLDFDLNIVTFPTGATTYEGTSIWQFNMFIESSPDGSTWTPIGQYPNYITVTQTAVATPTNIVAAISIPTVNLTSGEFIRVSLLQGGNARLTFKDSGGSTVTSPSASIRFDLNPNSVFEAKLAYPDLEEGGTVRLNDVIPKDVTQLDFLTSIIRLENLYFEPSKTIKNQYIVETREDYIDTDGNNALIWTDKWDISKGQEVIPMGELDFNRMRFTYKQDQDYFNKLYQDKYKEVYGTEIVDIENDFVKKEKLVEVAFSASPMVGSYVNDLVTPAYYSKDPSLNTVKPIKVNIRRLYWGGLISCVPHIFKYNGTDHVVSEYPFVGHVDNPLTPTVDLCWDNPFELYYDFPGNTYTDNGRYNERWSKFISEITDQNSKIVRMWFYLTETDIANFSFSKLVFVRDTYYLVNKIMDYNPQVKGVTQVELLKLKAGSVFVPDVINIDDFGGDDDPGGFDRLGNTNNGTGLLLGTGNYNNQSGVLVVGNGNVIG